MFILQEPFLSAEIAYRRERMLPQRHAVRPRRSRLTRWASRRPQANGPVLGRHNAALSR
jgi:hypothetical protein